MLPSDFVLRVDEQVECVFVVVGIHLEVLVRESTSNSLDQHESKGRAACDCWPGCHPRDKEALHTTVNIWDIQECAGFDNVVAAGGFVGFGPFDPMHFSASRLMIVHKFDDEDLGTVL
jgi:hypothetical protein